MTDAPIHSPQEDSQKRRPSFGAQLVATLTILLATGAVFGGIWLIDVIAH